MHGSRVQRSAQSPFPANPITHEFQWARARDRTHKHIYTHLQNARLAGGVVVETRCCHTRPATHVRRYDARFSV
jgi:hypothetical protein